MLRRRRCKVDPDLVLLDYGYGYVEAVLEVADEDPIIMGIAKLPEGRSRGYWIVAVDRDYSDPLSTKSEALELLDFLAAKVRHRIETDTLNWREDNPRLYQGLKSKPATKAS